MYERVQQDQKELQREISVRNKMIRRSLDLERQGLQVNYTLYDEEASLFRHMRLSKEDRYSRLRNELWRLCEEHLERPL